ncbi:MAG: hypothetical protein KIS73_08790 [Enhydrobacter sp.]|nr:hypothetical protein [Enhydrobacter sp.]
MTAPASKTQIVMARTALGLMVVFVVLGVTMYGLSTEVFSRIWQNTVDRAGGPMTFRFILQPIMASIAALYDGFADARSGRSHYLWTVMTNPAKRLARLREGVIATSRILLLGLTMDTIYQYIVFDTFHPAEAVIITLLLAFAPYVLLRGPVSRVVSWWRGGAPADVAR